MDRILESLFIEIALPNNSKFTIGTLYRPGATHPTLTPQELFHEFIELFSNLLDNISDRSNLIILGDFNLDVLQFGSNNKCNDYVDLLFSFGLLQIVTRPTRCNDNSATLIDHIVTNIKAPVYDINILTSRISDHFPVIFTLPFNQKIPSSNKTITKRFFTNENVLKFKTALNNINWNVVRDAEDAQVSYNSFSDIFFNFYELYFPKVTLKVNKKIHKIEPWFSAGLLVSRNTKFLLSSNCSKNPSPSNTTKYKTYRNLYNHVLRAAKKKYYDTEFQKNTSNLKRTWELIKSAMNANSSKQTITNLFVDGINHTEPCDIANVLNQFFVSAPAKIVEQIPPAGDPTINFNNEVIFSMQDSPITETEIF
jgi:hypothetical protein